MEFYEFFFISAVSTIKFHVWNLTLTLKKFKTSNECVRAEDNF